MIAVFNRIDDWLIVQAQRAYLWLYDWTGVYVGTLLFLLVASSWGIDMYAGRASIYLTVFGLLIVTPMCWYRIHLQSTNETLYNALAEKEKQGVGRKVVLIAIVGFSAWELATSSWLRLVCEPMWFTLFYLIVIKIRKREPKEFFERQAAGATK